MNRPWIIWSLSALCALLVFGAMGLLTRNTLSLERDRVEAEARAEFEGWIRIALWRMDTAAAGILAEENNKPASHFRDVTLQGANLELLCAAAEGSREVSPDKPLWQAQVDIAQQQRKDNPKAVVRNTQAYQTNYNIAEKVKRQEIVSKAVANSAPQRKVGAARSAKKQRSSKVIQPARTSEAALSDALLAQDQEPEQSVADDAGKEQSGVSFSPLIPVWLGDDLVLVRQVSGSSGNGGAGVQGVWLDANAIRASLLSDISDLLPEARLVPVRHGVDVLLGAGNAGGENSHESDDPMVMAALPWRLVPGEVAMIDSLGWTPMRKNLLVAWIGAALAALAAVMLLRGVVKLSERRASFVSSVTHELRTPLTTFSLYSDMLAEGMVQDEKKQREYLQTLRRESARLTHLVENVLAYSRIERGSARAQVETVRVGDILERMELRLRQRVEEAGMELCCELSPEVAQHEIRVDTTAVEQIIFNLVDNASKYASGENCGTLVTLRAFQRGLSGRGSSGGGIVFQVCDQGPGVRRSEHRRLFRAFHKSAQEAAHSKPGVGLGLALSRRLARALGGDLKIIEQEKGACFELEIDS